MSKVKTTMGLIQQAYAKCHKKTYSAVVERVMDACLREAEKGGVSVRYDVTHLSDEGQLIVEKMLRAEGLTCNLNHGKLLLAGWAKF